MKNIRIKTTTIDNDMLDDTMELMVYYEIFYKDINIAKGLDNINITEISNSTINEYILKNLEKYLKKPNINDYGCLMKYCVNTIMMSEEPCIFVEYEHFIDDNFNQNDLNLFNEECNKLNLIYDGIVEVPDNVNELKNYTLNCYGALNFIFDISDNHNLKNCISFCLKN